MLPTDTIYTANMNDHQRGWFYAEYEEARKDEIVGILLAFFLGTFGIHHFYLRRNGLGILYLCFFWTGITAILGFVECFFMPGRVRVFNAMQASYIAVQILAHPSPNGTATPSSEAAPPVPAASIPSTRPCTACRRAIDPAAAFCPHCGAARTVAV